MVTNIVLILLSGLLGASGFASSFGVAPKRQSGLTSTSIRAKAAESPDLSNTLVFSGVKFHDPISSSLRSLGISEPSPIQKASIAQITSGLSCILHAQTGSGKTLAYLLPLLKRLTENDGSIDMKPLQGLIIVPSKELAVQVAADITTLLSKSHELDSSVVELCLKTSRGGLDSVLAPIVVGTPFKVLDALKASSPQLIESMNYLVLDEVDRLISSLSKYATSEKRREAREETNPTIELVELLVRSKIAASLPQMQVVAASATVGRQLRRDLFKLLEGGEEFGDLTVIRPVVEEEVGSSSSKHSVEVDETGDDNSSSKSPSTRSGSKAQSGSTRKVGIPTDIRHVAVLTRDDSIELNRKVVAAKEKWVGECVNANRGLLFVPRPDDIKQILGMLQFWGVKEAQNLQETLGIEVDSEAHQKMTIQQKRNLAYNKPSPAAVPASVPVPKTVEAKASESAELILRAARSRLGATSRSAVGTNTAGEKVEAGRELFVLPVSGSRGLHLQDVEYVIILQPPKTMDEYLHMAGRTGRAGNKVSGGTVISLVNFDELKRMQSWQTALGIEFDVEYE
jgi:superfamily II DNA/RNA helicase